MIMTIVDTPGTQGDNRLSGEPDLDFDSVDACIIVYSIENRESFEELQEIKEKVDEQFKETNCNPVYFLVGNKADERLKGYGHVIKQEGADFKRKRKIHDFSEVSANDH